MSKELPSMVEKDSMFIKKNSDNYEKENYVKRITKKCGQSTTKTLQDVQVPKMRCHQIIMIRISVVFVFI